MIKTFTAFRFLFAMMVLLSHLCPSSNRFFFEGFLGVGFFYMLSGFVLSYSYKEKLLIKDTGKKDFFIARIARIYPLHLVTFSIAFLLQFITQGVSLGKILIGGINLTLLQSYLPIQSIYFSYNSVSWSISDEMFFYIAFPFILPFLIRANKKVIIFCLLALIIALNIFLPEDYKHAFLYINPFTRIADFIIGIYLCEIFLIVKEKKMPFVLTSICELLAITFLILLIFYSVKIPISFRYSIYYWPAMAMILLSFSFQAGIISRILSSRILIFLGEASFSLYMTHYLIIRNLMPQLKSIISDKYLLNFLIIGICILVSIISFYYIEKPGGRIVKSIFSRFRKRNEVKGQRLVEIQNV